MFRVYIAMHIREIVQLIRVFYLFSCWSKRLLRSIFPFISVCWLVRGIAAYQRRLVNVVLVCLYYWRNKETTKKKKKNETPVESLVFAHRIKTENDSASTQLSRIKIYLDRERWSRANTRTHKRRHSAQHIRPIYVPLSTQLSLNIFRDTSSTLSPNESKYSLFSSFNFISVQIIWNMINIFAVFFLFHSSLSNFVSSFSSRFICWKIKNEVLHSLRLCLFSFSLILLVFLLNTTY